MKTPITWPQRRVLNFVKRFIKRMGYPPSRAEIATALGFASTNAADCHLKTLAQKRFIRLTPDISRGLKVIAR
jgi:repressor LexA